MDQAQQEVSALCSVQEDALGLRVQAMKLAQMIRVWAAMNGVQHAELAEQWKCAASTVTRFLKNEQSPDGPTMGRISAWTLGEMSPEHPVDAKELERRVDRLERILEGDRAAIQAATMLIPIGGQHG